MISLQQFQQLSRDRQIAFVRDVYVRKLDSTSNVSVKSSLQKIVEKLDREWNHVSLTLIERLFVKIHTAYQKWHTHTQQKLTNTLEQSLAQINTIRQREREQRTDADQFLTHSLTQQQNITQKPIRNHRWRFMYTARHKSSIGWLIGFLIVAIIIFLIYSIIMRNELWVFVIESVPWERRQIARERIMLHVDKLL